MARKPGTPEHMKRIAKLAGRKKGTKNPATITREQALLEYKEKVCRVADQLFMTQLTLAKGFNCLYKVTTEIVADEDGKKAKVFQSKPTRVTDPNEIEMYLDGKFEEVKPGQPGTAYFILAESKPDASVIDSMLDRTFGRAMQTTDITSKGKQINFNDRQRAAIARRIITDNGKS
jgi:hypothetical protein